MSKTLRGALMVACTLPFLATTAHAGLIKTSPAEGGFYVSGYVGLSAPSDADFDGTQMPAAGVPGTAGTDAEIEVDFDSDIYFGGSIGYHLPIKYFKYFQPRIELEVSYTENDVSSSGTFNDGNQSFSGEQSRTYFLIRNASDIVWKENQRIVPFFGGGIGIGDFDTDIQYFDPTGTATTPTSAVQGSDTALTTMSSIGATFKANEKFDLYVEGRYFKSWSDVDAENRSIVAGSTGFNADVDDKPSGFTVAVGTRLNF